MYIYTQVFKLPWSIIRVDKELNFSWYVCMASDHCLDMTDNDALTTSVKSSMLEACWATWWSSFFLYLHRGNQIAEVRGRRNVHYKKWPRNFHLHLSHRQKVLYFAKKKERCILKEYNRISHFSKIVYLFQNIAVFMAKQCKPCSLCPAMWISPKSSTRSPEHMTIKRQRSFDKAT